MVMSEAEVVNRVEKILWPAFKAEKDELDELDKLWRMKNDQWVLPRKATKEHKALQGMARSPYLDLLITTVAQGLHVDSYRSPNDASAVAGWKTWVMNGMVKNQSPIHRDAVGYGIGYLRLMEGNTATRMMPRSPRQVIALYDEPAYDEWPRIAMEVIGTDKQGYRLEVIDDDGVTYKLTCGATGDGITYKGDDGAREDLAGFCPVVRYTSDLDTEGRTQGLIEKQKTVTTRIEKTDYDRLLVQHFNSWKVRTIAGLVLAEGDGDDDSGSAEQKKMKLAQEDFLVAADPNTKFGTLDDTALDGFIKARDSDVETAAGTGQVPGTALTGKVSNLSAEAISELRAGLNLQQFNLKNSFGYSHNSALRGCARLDGRPGADDYEASVHWQDINTISLQAAVDAYGKAVTMLGIPPDAFWGALPGFTQQDVTEWEARATKGGARQRLDALQAAAAEVRNGIAAAGVGVGQRANAQ